MKIENGKWKVKNVMTAAIALILNSQFSILNSSAAQPIECVVYSPVESSSTLRLSTISGDTDADETRWTFPSSYTGHRAVCRLPEATSNDSFIAWLGGDAFTPGDWMGVSTAMAYPLIGLTRSSPICNRIGIWSGASDRDDNWNQVLIDKCLKLPEVVSWIGGDEAKRTWYGNFLSNRVSLARPPVIDRPTRVRVVRYAVDDRYCYSVGGVPQRTVLDKVFQPDGRDFLCEADFLGNGKFDLDWDYLKSEVCDRLPAQSYGITNVTYLIVVGDGPTSFSGTLGTNTTVNAMPTMVTRRFDRSWSAPRAIGLAEGGTVYGSRLTFVWSMPDEDPWAKRFGSSYTAFRIQMLDVDENKLTWTSDVMRAPPQDESDRFVFEQPFIVGGFVFDKKGGTPIIKRDGNYQWRVSMYNAKFPPAAKIADNVWSEIAEFSTSSGPQPRPDEPQPQTPEAVECVVYSRRKSKSSLHVSTVVTNAWSRPRQWTFPSSYTGHRAVCRLAPATTNDDFCAWIGGDTFTPGDPFGCSNGRDYPVIGLTRVSPICNRIDIWSGETDRDDGFDLSQYSEWNRRRTENPNEMSGMNIIPVRPTGDKVRIRIVRYAVNGFFTYSVGVTNRVVADMIFDRRSGSLTESSILSGVLTDIDYEHFKREAYDLHGSYYNPTNASYLVVVGDGPVGFTGYWQTNDFQRVSALADKIGRPVILTRRFDKNWSAPKDLGLKGGSILRMGERPTFVWTMNEDNYSKAFGSSYTSFRIQIAKRGEEEDTLIVIGPFVAPIKGEDGKYEFTLQSYAGDQTPVGKLLARKGDFSWCISMYNSKFKPSEYFDDEWSDISEFTVQD